MTDQPDTMDTLIATAKEGHYWLQSTYFPELWLSPGGLENEQAHGRFQWGPANWRLVDPRERLKELHQAMLEADRAYNEFGQRLVAENYPGAADAPLARPAPKGDLRLLEDIITYPGGPTFNDVRLLAGIVKRLIEANAP